ncbi:MAG: glycosyltransferase family 2 protein [Beijerinckiaceae bacterium]
MNADASVSVIVPTFNSAGTIIRAINSALDQSYGPLEVIIVDDCSVDDTLNVLKATFGSDSRIRVLSSPANLGPSAARNRAISAARGAWIALLDADDAWAAERLAQIMPKANGLDVVADNLLAYDARAGRTTGLLFRSPVAGDIDLPGLVGTVDLTDLGLLKPIFRLAFVQEHGLRYDESLRYAEDLIFYCELLHAGARFHIVSSAGYIYTMPYGRLSKSLSPHSRTSIDNKRLVAAIEAFSQRYQLQKNANFRAALHTRLSYYRKRAHWDRLAVQFARHEVFGCLQTTLLHPSVLSFAYRRLRARLLTRR